LAKSIVTRTDDVRTLERKKALVARGSISQSDYDAAEAKADASIAQVDVDRARLTQMEAKLNEAELQLRYTRIEAPVDGVVEARSMDVGQTVTASFQTPLLFKIAEDLTRMQVHTNVDEADIGRVRVGQKAAFSVTAFPDEVFTAAVTQIRNDPKIEQNVVTYDVVLDVENHELKLRPGMTADVHILLHEIADAIMIPDQAIRFTPGKKTGKNEESQELPALKQGEKRVWKLVQNNRIVPVTVTVGVAGTERTQLLAGDLKPGDRVVLDSVSRDKPEEKSTAIRFRF
jgi:HlyD family secretion protein